MEKSQVIRSKIKQRRRVRTREAKSNKERSNTSAAPFKTLKGKAPQ